MCLLSPPLACNPSYLSRSCSALQSFTFISQLRAAVSASALQSLHLSSSAGLLCPPLPCNPEFLHLSPNFDCCVRLCLICILASLSICLPPLDCCIRLYLAILYLSPSSRLHVASNALLLVSLCRHLSPSSGLLWPPLPCNPLSPNSGRRKL